mgnify:CR=1 FL=1
MVVTQCHDYPISFDVNQHSNYIGGHVVSLESMIPFVIYKDPIHVKANDIRQIEAAVKWANEQDLNIVIVGGRDSWINPKILVENNIPVILLGVQVTPYRRFEPIHIPYLSLIHI